MGAGSTFITSDVASQRTSVADYEGVVLHSGLAIIYDTRVFNIGVATSIDQLLRPDGPHWMYQRKPWFGILFGLNLN